MYCGLIINDKDVVAWCKLSDIEPYKEECLYSRSSGGLVGAAL